MPKITPPIKIPDFPVTWQWNREHDSCYDDARLKKLFTPPVMLSECMVRMDEVEEGNPDGHWWADVPFGDRLNFIYDHAFGSCPDLTDQEKEAVNYRANIEWWANETDRLFRESISEEVLKVIKAAKGADGGFARLGAQAPNCYLSRMWENKWRTIRGVQLETRAFVSLAFLSLVETK